MLSGRAAVRGERGSVLMLMPAAVLVFVVLGAICVDTAVVFLAKRELSNAAAAAANDAATRAIDLDRFYADGTVRLVPAEAHRVAAAALAGARLDHLRLAPPQVSVAGAEVTVVLRAEVEAVFAGGVPGAPRSSTVSATARATARE